MKTQQFVVGAAVAGGIGLSLFASNTAVARANPEPMAPIGWSSTSFALAGGGGGGGGGGGAAGVGEARSGAVAAPSAAVAARSAAGGVEAVSRSAVVVGVLAGASRPAPLVVVPVWGVHRPGEDPAGWARRPAEDPALRAHPVELRMGHPAVPADPWARRQRWVPAARAVLRKVQAPTAAAETPRLRPPAGVCPVRCPVVPIIPLPGRGATIPYRAGGPAVPAVHRPGPHGPGGNPYPRPPRAPLPTDDVIPPDIDDDELAPCPPIDPNAPAVDHKHCRN